jgi:hypothetical protein
MYAYFALLTLLTAVSLYLARVNRGAGPKLELTPCVMLATSYFAYSAAVPVSRLLFRTDARPADEPYMLCQAVGAAGITLGFLFVLFRRQFDRRIPPAAVTLHLRGGLVFAAVLATSFLYYYTALRRLNFNWSAVLSPYGMEAAIDDSYDFVSVIVPILAIAGGVVGCFAALRRELGVTSRLLVAVLIGLLGLFLLTRGARNAFIMLVVPVVVIARHGRRLSLARVLPLFVAAWLFFYFVAIVRNHGVQQYVANGESARLQLAAFDPLSGELGTTSLVFEKSVNVALDGDYLFGTSYLVDPLVNVVPRALYRDRPPTLAQWFSMRYFATARLKEGLGFSPVLEALFNFGLAGIAPVMALMAVLVAWLEKRFDVPGGHRLLYYGALVPMVINFNRIDFATVVKMSVLTFAAMYVLIRCSGSSRRIVW